MTDEIVHRGNSMAYVVEMWVFKIILPPATLGRTPPVWKSSALPGLSSVYASHSCGFCFCTVRGCHCPRLDQFIILIRAITRTHPRVIKFWGFRSHRGQQEKLCCLISGLPDPICLCNLQRHSFRSYREDRFREDRDREDRYWEL